MLINNQQIENFFLNTLITKTPLLNRLITNQKEHDQFEFL